MAQAETKDSRFVLLAPNRTDLYWRPESRGYTTRLGHAGVYTAEEAARIVSGGRGDRSVALSSLRDEMVRERAELRKEIDGLTLKIRMTANLKGGLND